MVRKNNRNRNRNNNNNNNSNSSSKSSGLLASLMGMFNFFGVTVCKGESTDLYCTIQKIFQVFMMFIVFCIIMYVIYLAVFTNTKFF